MVDTIVVKSEVLSVRPTVGSPLGFPLAVFFAGYFQKSQTRRSSCFYVD